MNFVEVTINTMNAPTAHQLQQSCMACDATPGEVTPVKDEQRLEYEGEMNHTRFTYQLIKIVNGSAGQNSWQFAWSDRVQQNLAQLSNTASLTPSERLQLFNLLTDEIKKR